MNKNRTLCFIASIAVAAAMIAKPAAAGDWQLTLAPYLWAISMDGNVGVRNQKREIDASFGDILDASDSILAFNADVKLHNGRFGFLFGPSYAQLGVDDVANGTPLEADFTTDLLFIDAAAEYRVVDWPMTTGSGEETRVTIDALAGVRYSRLSVELDFDNAGSPSKDVDWWDPIVGADAEVDLSPRWFLALRGDVGGFGAGSEFTTNGMGTVGFRFSLFGADAAIRAGYRAIYQDYDEGSFKWRMNVHGPILGLVTHWG